LMDELTLATGAPANGGSCVARHEGRVVFVRYALPGEQVRVRVVADHGSYWHADVVEVLQASPDRIDSLCPIAGVDGAGCCDLAFAAPEAARRLKGAVVANQLSKLGGYHWCDEADAFAEPVGAGAPIGWRTRVRLDTSDDGRAGFHRYHSAELVTDLRCGPSATTVRATSCNPAHVSAGARPPASSRAAMRRRSASTNGCGGYR
jgi:tRNA/tmRNA/rRNA uracil-C5-methylase (TrmA/RlmC/RlmD family)